MQKFLICTSLFFWVFLKNSSLANLTWNLFKSEFSKNYLNKNEENYRLGIFARNQDYIARHNRLYDKGLVSFNMSLNGYGDLTDTEYNGFMKGYRRFIGRKFNNIRAKLAQRAQLAAVPVPKSIDWREKGAVGKVGRQEKCGACWAFASAAAVEGQHFRKTGRLIPLSPQNLLDCVDPNERNKCGGGSLHRAFEYIKKNGIDTDKSYPYKAVGGSCKFKRRSVGATIQDYEDVAEGNENKLKEAIATIGPITVAVDSSHSSFEFYSSGIYYEPKCSSKNLDHAVLAVGYGTDQNGQDYYIIKNSWGTDWGENGYMRLARNRHNHCGVATDAIYPVV